MKAKFLPALFAFAMLFCHYYGNATNYYWVPSSGTNWGTLANWKTGDYTGTSATVLPGSSDNVYIGNSGGDVTLNIDNNRTVANITFEGSTTLAVTYSNSSYTLTAGSNLTVNSTGTVNMGTGILTGANFTVNSGTFNASSTTNARSQFNLLGGTFNAGATLNVGAGVNAPFSTAIIFTNNGGTFNAGTGTVVFIPTGSRSHFQINIPTTTTFYNVTLNVITTNYACYIETGSLQIAYVSNNLNHNGGVIGGQWDVARNLTVGPSAQSGGPYNSTPAPISGTITFSGDQNSYYTYTGRDAGTLWHNYYGNSATGHFVINKTGASVSPAGGTTNLVIAGLTIQSGTFDAPSGTLIIGPGYNGIGSLFGKSGGIFNPNNGTVHFLPLGSATTYTVNVGTTDPAIFYNLIIELSFSNYACTISTSSLPTPVISNNLTHRLGALNGDWELRGNLYVETGAGGGTGTVIMTGNSEKGYAYSGSGGTCNLKIDKGNGSVIPISGTTALQSRTFTLQSGSFTSPSGNYTLGYGMGGPVAQTATVFSNVGGNFYHNNGTVYIYPTLAQYGANGSSFYMNTQSSTLFYNMNIHLLTYSTTNILSSITSEKLNIENDLTLNQGRTNVAGFNVKRNVSVLAPYNGGTAPLIFKGNANQTFTLGAATLYQGNITIDKTGGKVSLGSALTLATSGQTLTLTSGNLESTSSNLLTLNSGTNYSGGSDNSYVCGPMKRIGSTAFTFPVGGALNGTNRYRPVSVSAPGTATDAFTAQYFNTNGVTGVGTGITDFDRCEYWNLTRNVGTSQVYVSLTYSDALLHTSCLFIPNMSYSAIATSNGTQWSKSGTSSALGGVVTTTSSNKLASWGDITLAQTNPKVHVSAYASEGNICLGASTTLSAVATGGLGALTYVWSPTMGLSSSTIETPVAAPTVTTTYTVTVTDGIGQSASGSTTVTVNPLPTVEITPTSAVCGNNGSVSSTATGGTTPYTYVWNDGQTGANVSGLVAGVHSVTIIDAAGCTASASGTVDPGCGVKSVMLDVLQDANITSQTPTQTHGSETSNASYSWTCNNINCLSRDLIQFNLAAIPAGAIIKAASIYLYADPASTLGNLGQPTYYSTVANGSTSNKGWIERATKTWSESSVTWESWTGGPAGTTLTNRVPLEKSVLLSQDYINVEVTDLVKDAIASGHNYGFVIHQDDEVTQFNSLIFASSNNLNTALHPKLVVYYSAAPTVTISALPATEICANTSVTFTADPGNACDPQYQWKVNGNNVGTNSNIFTSTTLTGGDEVTCVVTTSALCGASYTATSNPITITNYTGPLSANISGGGVLCSNEYISLQAGPSTSIAYSWHGPNGFSSTGQSILVPALNNGGTYTVTVTYPNGCTASAFLNVTVNTPSVTFAVNQTSCTDYQFAVNSSQCISLNAISSCDWSFGDGTIQHSTTLSSPISHTYAGGVYTVTLNLTDVFGRTASYSKQVTVVEDCCPAVTASQGVTICNGNLGRISVTVSNAGNLLSLGFNSPNIVEAIINGANTTYRLVVSPTETTVYHFTATSKFADCPNIDIPLTVTVEEPVIAVNQLNCAGYVFTLENAGCIDMNNVLRSDWDFGDMVDLLNLQGLSSSVSHTYGGTGNYTVTLNIYYKDGTHTTYQQNVNVRVNCCPTLVTAYGETACAGSPSVLTFVVTNAQSVNNVTLDDPTAIAGIPDVGAGRTIYKYTVTPNATQNYTLTVNSSHSFCAPLVAHATAIVKPLPAINITPAQTVCPGEIINNVVATSNASKFHWSPSTPARSGRDGALYTSTVIPYLLGTTTFDVTVTGDNNCTASASSTITLLTAPNFPIITAPANRCGNLVPYSVAAQAGVTYTWTISGIDYTAPGGLTGSTINITWGDLQSGYNYGTLTVTATGANGCTNKASLQIIPCCSASSTLTECTMTVPDNITTITDLYNYYSNVANTAAASCSPTPSTAQIEAAFSNPSGYYQIDMSQLGNHYNLFFRNGIVIDHDTRFINCDELRFGALQKIQVNAGMHLDIQNSVLTGSCNYMWQGIATAVNATVTVNGSTITEAINGIAQVGCATVHVTNTFFTDDYQGIVASNCVTSDMQVTGCTFKSDQGLWAPHIGENYYTGIRLYKMGSLQIGDNTNPNRFYGMNYGVVVNSSNLTLTQQNYFYDISRPQGAQLNGIAVWCLGGTGFTFSGTGYTTDKQINNCDYGIKLTNVSMPFDIQYIQIDQTDVGIDINNVNGSTGIVGDNRITDCRIGIHYSEGTGGVVAIFENFIKQVDLPGLKIVNTNMYGIWMQQSVATGCTTTVCSNYIIPNRNGTGIYAQSIYDNGLIIDNQVHWDANTYGGATYSAIANPTLQTNVLSNGIVLENTLAVLAYANHVFNNPANMTAAFKRQAVVLRSTNGVTLQCNDSYSFSTHYLIRYTNSGLKMDGNIIDDYNTGISFRTLKNTVGAPYSHSNIDNRFLNPKPSATEIALTFSASSVSVNFAFDAYFNINTVSGNVNRWYTGQQTASFSCPPLLEGAHCIVPIITGERMALVSNSEAAAIADGSIYDPEVITPALYRELKRNLYLTASASSSYLSDPVYADYVSAISATELGEFTSAYTTASEIIASEIIAGIVTVDNTPEAFEQQVDNIYLYHVSSGADFSEADKATLEYIASLCPLDAGYAVYRAASVIHMYNPLYEFNDEANCEVVSSKKDKANTSAGNKELVTPLLVYPNPAKNTITVNYVFDQESNYELKITDMLGKVVHTMRISSKNANGIDISYLAQGAYFITVNDGTNTVGKTKLIVVN